MTDNITPLVPEAKAAMTTNEIIDRLKQVSFTYSRLTADCLSAGEVARDKQALTAAIQAVELLEQIKAELHNECIACAHFKRKMYEKPCAVCFDGEEEGTWEFRWPLKEEADQ